MVEEQHVAFEELLTKKSVIECFVDYIEETDYDAEKIKMYRYRHLDLPSAFTIAPTDEIKENDDNEVEHPEWNDWIARIIELTEKGILQGKLKVIVRYRKDLFEFALNFEAKHEHQ